MDRTKKYIFGNTTRQLTPTQENPRLSRECNLVPRALFPSELFPPLPLRREKRPGDEVEGNVLVSIY